MKATRSSYSGRVLAAGAGINLVAGLLCLLVLVASVGAFHPAASGAGIVGVGSGTPAGMADVRPGDIITQFNGQNVTDLSSVLGPNTTLKAGQSVNLTVFRNGQILHINNVKVACCYVVENLQTKQNTTFPYIGVSQISGSGLMSLVTAYAAPLSNPWQYVCIPTLPACQSRVPFSDAMGVFYTSPLGSAGVPFANLIYWLFFLNFNLAIFNALPIYPLDGGQAFLVGVKALGKGKLSDRALMRITGTATLVVVALILGVIVSPYLF